MISYTVHTLSLCVIHYKDRWYQEVVARSRGFILTSRSVKSGRTRIISSPMLLASSPWDLEWRFLVSWKRDEWKPEWDTRKQHTPRQEMIRKENLNEQISWLIEDRSLLTGSSFIGVDFWDGNWDELHSRYWVTRKHHRINQPKKFKFDSSRGNSMTSESFCNMTFVIVDKLIAGYFHRGQALVPGFCSHPSGRWFSGPQSENMCRCHPRWCLSLEGELCPPPDGMNLFSSFSA